MSEQKIFEIPASAKEKAWIDTDNYLKMYQEAVEDPVDFGINRPIDWTGSKNGTELLIGITIRLISAGMKEENLTFLIIVWTDTWKHEVIKRR